MKRIIAVIIALVMMVTALIPLNVFAESERSLEEIIKIAKSKFDVPEKYSQFNYNVNSEVNGKKVWYLNWTSKDGMDGGMSVSVDSNGKVLSYSNYKPYDSSKRNFPKISREEAKQKADAFIKKIILDWVPSLRYNDNSQNALSEPVFYLNYTRMANGIPFYNNYVNVEVNRETGEIQSYYSNWMDEAVFPAADKAISMEKAQEAFKEKLGLRLVYLSNYDGKKIKIFPAYVSKYDISECIDANTGERISLQTGYYGPGYGGMYDVARSSMKEMAANVDAGNIVLSPEEQNAVEKVSKLITKEAAEKIAREFKHLGLSADFRLSSASLSKEWSMEDEFTWYLYFESTPSGDRKEYKSASARINAATGEIRGFYSSYPNNATEGKIDEAAAKKAVEAFLKEVQPSRFDQTEFDDTQKTYYPVYMDNNKPTQFNFRYIRLVNGAYFPGNSLYVTYDAVNGKILNYEMTWFNIEFPAIDKAIAMDNAYEKFFGQIGLELQYGIKYPDEYALKFSPGSEAAKPEIKLVYATKKDKPTIFDAFTGIILNYDGQPFKEVKPAVYSDISGHYAEKQILALADNGIALEGSEFKPENSITQKDFLYMLAKSLHYNNYELYTGKETKEETDKLYAFLIREGVVKENEKAPDQQVKKEDGIKFIIRALKFERVAAIKEIFICTFKDKSQINPDIIGYVSIAQGLKIVSGNDGYLNPKNNLTRAEGAVMIYNYMQ